MGRRRHIASLVLGAFSAALTILPWLHTLHHRDDHVHVDGGIVFVGEHGEDDGNHVDHAHVHEHVDVDEDDDEDADEGVPGWDHPPHHQPHGRGALAHGSAFILAGQIFLFPTPVAQLERLPALPAPEAPELALLRAPRETRGPPAAARS